MHYVPSVLILLFSMTFLGIWFLDKKRKHLLIYSISFFCFAIGLLVQVLQFPGDKTVSVLLSSALYLAGALLFSEGVIVRSNRSDSRWIRGGLAGLIYAALVYLCYVNSSFLYLAAVVNIGMGLILLSGCEQARYLWRGNIIERLFLVVYILFALHFFLRIALTVGVLSDVGDPSQLVESPFWTVMSVTIAILSVCIGLSLLLVVTSDIVIELQTERDTDPLTGLLNRRGLERKMSSLKSKAGQADYHVIVADLDRFKLINDQFGHPVGDTVLIEFAQLLQTITDLHALSRVGGEEFVFILKASAEDVLQDAEAIRARVSSHQFQNLPFGYKLSCSFGVTSFRDGENFWSAFARADDALIAAKRDGRDRVFAEGGKLQKAYVL